MLMGEKRLLGDHYLDFCDRKLCMLPPQEMLRRSCVAEASIVFMSVPLLSPLSLSRGLKAVISRRYSATTLTGCVERTRSPYELVHFRRSKYVAHLNELRRRNALPPDVERDTPSALEEVLASAGNRHEIRIIEQLLRLISGTTAESPVIERIPMFSSDRFSRTEEAVRSRTPMIQQAALTDGFFAGYADLIVLDSVNPFLSPDARRVAHPAAYSIFEIKLASINRLEYSLQTAVYAKMLSEVLEKCGGPACRHAYLCLGNSVDAVKSLDVNALTFVLRRTTADFKEFLNNFNVGRQIPEIDAPLADLRPWAGFAQRQMDSSDSLLNIAGIRRSQARLISSELHASNLTAFANLPASRISEVSASLSPASKALQKLHLQAQLQAETSRKHDAEIAYRVLKPEDVYTSYGLNRVAPRHNCDVYFDIEGYPLFDGGGLEYLFGCTDESNGKFYSWWAHSRAEEEKSFVNLMNWFWVRAKAVASDDLMHIYHYGNYEIAAMRRVAARAITLEGKEAGRRLERLIGAGCFIDVYKIVKSGLVVGARSYSIKKVENLAGISRDGDELADAQSSVAMYHQWRSEEESDDNDTNLSSRMHSLTLESSRRSLLHDILMYNKQDCDSLRQVVSWLRRVACKNGIRYHPLPQTIEETSEQKSSAYAFLDESEHPPGACGRTDEEKAEDGRTMHKADALSALFLGSHIGTEKMSRLETLLERHKFSQEELHTLAHVLQFHAKESAPARYRFMDRVSKAYCLQFLELFDDHECIAPLQWISKSLDGKGALFEYKFDSTQATSIKQGSSVAVVIGSPAVLPSEQLGEDTRSDYITGFMKVTDIDKQKGTIGLKSNKDIPIPSDATVSLVRSDELILCPAQIRKSLVRVAEKALSERDEPSEIIRNFLSRKPVYDIPCSHAENKKDMVLTKITLPSFLQKLRNKTVVIQGPPGSGKTTYSSQLIRDLLDSGKTVAISSNSHAAIDNLLTRVVSSGFNPQSVCKIGPRTESLGNIRFASNLARVEIGAQSETWVPSGSPTSVTNRRRSLPKTPVALVGSTVYGLARVSESALFDYLFVDEASQVPMANFVAMAPCAKAAVLVGDQQQLQMPLMGAHADSVQKSCLSHLVGEGISIVSANRGIFLDTSYRMQPEICSFISENFYDGALLSHSSCATNHIQLPTSRYLPDGRERFLRKGQGIVFLDSNQKMCSGTSSRHSPGEAVMVAQVIEEVLGTNCLVNGAERTIEEKDILVVSSFNAQVQNLRQHVPANIRVGTVDKFQGQESPIVIISTCAVPSDFEAAAVSSSEEAGLAFETENFDRNLQFTTNPNRINVAVSRASCLAVVIGHSDATRRALVSNLEAASSYALYELLVECS